MTTTVAGLRPVGAADYGVPQRSVGQIFCDNIIIIIIIIIIIYRGPKFYKPLGLLWGHFCNICFHFILFFYLSRCIIHLINFVCCCHLCVFELLLHK